MGLTGETAVEDRFDVEVTKILDEDEEVEIETRRSPERPSSRLIIWVVVVDGQAYVRSVRGLAGRWYRNLVANPSGILHLRGRAVSVRAVAVTDPAINEKVSAEYLRKYATSPYAPQMTRGEVLSTTLRLEPA